MIWSPSSGRSVLTVVLSISWLAAAAAATMAGCASPPTGEYGAGPPVGTETETPLAFIAPTTTVPPTAASDAGVDIDALEARIAELEGQVAALGDGPVGVDIQTLAADLGQLADDVGAAGKRVGAQVKDAASRRRLEALGKRLGAMVDRLQDAMPDIDLKATIDPTVTGLFDRLRQARDTLRDIVPIGEPTATATPTP